MAKRIVSAARRLPALADLVERRIYPIRGQKVMLDSDLAELYQVETRVLKQAVRRNRARFPQDFMFQLTREEAAGLRSQIVILEREDGRDAGEEEKRGRHSKYAAFAFTEHGVAMLSSVLKSARAVQMNIVIIRAFVRMREVLAANRELARRLGQVEVKVRQHGAAICVVVDEIKKLRREPHKPGRRIGFVTDQSSSAHS